MSAADLTTQPATLLDASAAGQLVARIRGGLQALDADVAAAYHGAAHVALGYGAGAKGWAALCRDLFADVAWLRPTPLARLERVAELRRQEMSTRAIGDALGVSAATVTTDLRKLEQRGERLPDNVRSLDDRRRSSTGRRGPVTGGDSTATGCRGTATGQAQVSGLPAGLTELMRSALLLVALAGDEGMTQLELEEVAGWRQGRCTSLLFRLREAGLIRTEATRRDGYRVHVATLPD